MKDSTNSIIAFMVGLLMILSGIFLGLYIGVWLCFVGGIVQIINEIKSPEGVNALAIALGIVKIFFASPIGWLSATMLFIPGACIIGAAVENY